MNWSYAPYRPFFFESGDIYICRIEPHASSITLDWLDTGDAPCTVFCGVRGTDSFDAVGTTAARTFRIEGLEADTEYAFYVTCGEKKSRVRLARCGEAFGTVVNYLHPEDNAYSFSGHFLGSPSLLRLPDGGLLASMDLFSGGHPNNLTFIYRSDDDGATWHYLSELFPCEWGKLFLYEDKVYMLACDTAFGDLLIGRSEDGGRTFGTPTVLMRGSNGKNNEPGVHKNPQPVVECDGRIWNALEWGSWARGYFAAMVMSAPLGADLLKEESWTFSEPVKYDPAWPGLPAGETAGNLEGCLVVKDGTLYDVMRYDMRQLQPDYGMLLAYRADTACPAAPLTFDHIISLPANYAKTEIKQDPRTGKYYAIICRIIDSAHAHTRNLLSLMVSDDMESWTLQQDIMNRLEDDPKKIGFQYVDFFIENGVIYYLCRTAMNGANSYHNNNYHIFGKIRL